jgi:hypothetical protein
VARRPFKIDSSWSFQRFLDELFAYYRGGGVESTGRRCQTTRTSDPLTTLKLTPSVPVRSPASRTCPAGPSCASASVDSSRPEVHPRVRFGQRSVRYRHYIRELARKPQALRQIADDLLAELGEPFASAWRLLVDERGPREAARSFAQVLKGPKGHGEEIVAERIAADHAW